MQQYNSVRSFVVRKIRALIVAEMLAGCIRGDPYRRRRRGHAHHDDALCVLNGLVQGKGFKLMLAYKRHLASIILGGLEDKLCENFAGKREVLHMKNL